MHIPLSWSLGVLLLGGAVGAVGAEEIVAREGGLGFRFDDNQTAAKWREMAAVFEKHGFPMMMSLNYGTLLSAPSELITELRRCAAAGHELMDHTPYHSLYRYRPVDADSLEKLRNHPAVDHVAGGTVFFRYVVRPEHSTEDFTGTVDGKILKVPSETAKLLQKEWVIYSPEQKTAFMTAKNGEDFELRSFWDERNVDLGKCGEFRFRILRRFWDFGIHPEALRILAEATRDAADRLDLPKPVTWIQPGGREPIIFAEDVREVYGRDFQYTSAATYQNAAYKVYNEPDPERCRYAMQWGNFSLEKSTPAELKKRIADEVAKHYVLFGSSHMIVSQVPGGWEEYLRRHDELLEWCRRTGIPVRTQREWTRRLYDPATQLDRETNVMPSLSLDRDEDGNPDGYVLGEGVSVHDGELERRTPGRMFTVTRLSGMEKGSNRFSFEGKGPEGGRWVTQLIYHGRKGELGAEDFSMPIRSGASEVFSVVLNIPEEAVAMTVVVRGEGTAGTFTLKDPSLRP